MKFGIAFFAADFAIRPDELAVAVEERGFESLFFAEHTHLPVSDDTTQLDPEFSHMYDLYVSLAYALGATSRLLVGSGVTQVPEHDPFNAAKALASLDVLSQGRLLVGIGAGWIDQEVADHGVDPRRKWGATLEYLEAIQTIWANDVAEFHGRHLDFGPMWSWPKPFRVGGPPILLGGNGPRAVERALKLGCEWFPEDDGAVDALAGRIAGLHRLAQETDRPPVPVSLYGVAPDAERFKQIEQAGVHRVAVYAPCAGRDVVLRFLDDLAVASGL
jgi:probable F420-dependent oxidoreductase